ncbi:ImmA/IrrE family metallo-endopeptidase [Mumia sp. zg.B53]|uniref:ImmA/IrrE family metallo-endopeptidase n=1 Tax=Mumia sp. zg.B53 TaxID=2855449 RepID=UPI001C6ED59C
MDAFLFRYTATPVFFLNVHKSAPRLPDLAHELGHLVIHRGRLYVESGKDKEQAAKRFREFVLIPRVDVTEAIRGNTSWLGRADAQASPASQCHGAQLRAHRPGVISDWTYSTLPKQLSAREAGLRSTRGDSNLLTQVLGDWRDRGQASLTSRGSSPFAHRTSKTSRWAS